LAWLVTFFKKLPPRGGWGGVACLPKNPWSPCHARRAIICPRSGALCCAGTAFGFGNGGDQIRDRTGDRIRDQAMINKKKRLIWCGAWRRAGQVEPKLSQPVLGGWRTVTQ